MSTAGIIFSNLNEDNFSSLTEDRTVAAIPFGCRYRLIDFALSNMVNSNITNISVIANSKYRSLVEHLGAGKDWDMARRSGGIKFISPYFFAHSSEYYSHRLEALRSMTSYIRQMKEDTLVLSDCDIICNIDLNAVISMHHANRADLTMVTTPCKPDFSSKVSQMMVKTNGDGKVQRIARSRTFMQSNQELFINIFVFRTAFLAQLLDEAIAYNFQSLTNDLIMRSPESQNFYTYCYTGYVAPVSDFQDYYRASMELLSNENARMQLFGKRDRPLFTKVHNSPPTLYREGASVSGSMIADGCVIEGTVENSILFRGVRVGRGSVVRNSVLFGGCYVGNNSLVNCVVADKQVLISDNCQLSGHNTLPFYIEKNVKV